MDTIYALASARGKAGVSIVRISGVDAWSALEGFTPELPKPRVASLRNLTWQGEILDQALVLVFEKGASFTGETSVELHLHGSQATVKAVMTALAAKKGLRLAEAGEFTRRALENGCLDLAQVEGLADLIEAETESQRKQALRVLSGAIGRKADSWRLALIRASALLAATIDFVDEDVPVDVTPEVHGILNDLLVDLQAQVHGSQAAERIRDGFEVAIIGPPNVGKSTLLNVLAGREAAIISEIAGTTRDVIELRMDLDGLAVTFLDTAGLRETIDPIEKIGIGRAVERANSADLRLFLRSAGQEEASFVSAQSGDLVVWTKADLAGVEGFQISAKTGLGVAELVAQIVKILKERTADASQLIRERHRLAVEGAIIHVKSALSELHYGLSRTEIATEELRCAVRALDVLVGRIDVEQILGEIFASFCIGK
ncbi:MAG: tRNA uridine-5-carboxymethylaminomethyl(34) synthesis GTPase MnmE [Paracoccaceae bacterium]|nr:tRNA uridine-5-carboxymethylaminomethyl(34) synthesis GTPase MnmE [Paracoccaceae bacterium]